MAAPIVRHDNVYRDRPVEETDYPEVKSKKLNHNEVLRHDPKVSGATKEAAKSKVLEHKQAGHHARLNLESQVRVNGQPVEAEHKHDVDMRLVPPRGGRYLPDIKEKSETVWVNGQPVSPSEETDHKNANCDKPKDTI
jgi:hypothetical protein